MIAFSVRAQVADSGPAPMQWARKLADLFTKVTGTTLNTSARVGGHNEIIWVAQYDTFEAGQAAQAKAFADPGYVKLLEEGRGLFIMSTVESAIWTPIP